MIRNGLCAALLAGLSHLATAAPAYQVLELAPISPTNCRACEIHIGGMNNAGQVVGYYYHTDTSGFSHSMLYSNGRLTELTNEQTGPYDGARANGINDAGQITGGLYINGANPWIYAAVYSNGQGRNLGSIGGPYASGDDINNAGQVAGTAHTGQGSVHAVLYDKGQVIDLGSLGNNNSSYSTGINNHGQVVGTTYLDGTREVIWHAFLYSDGVMQDLGTLGGSRSWGEDVNDAGQVVGYSTTADGNYLAFLYENGQMKSLGTLVDSTYSFAYDINARGQVIGSAGVDRPFLYEDGVMRDFQTLVGSEWQVKTVDDIADNGDIVGRACKWGTNECSIVLFDALEPLALGQIAVSQVPEPGTLGMMFAGLMLLLGVRRRAAIQ